MGLYDEMADCLNLRLLTIDRYAPTLKLRVEYTNLGIRWGLGRTEPRAKSAKGIIQWAGVVEEVLDLLRIEECSVMAHSAGGPYALSFGNKLQRRIRGDICLLAPWVGGTESGKTAI
jgi:alpha-beta hydrolase superfamily lysophospholipase